MSHRILNVNVSLQSINQPQLCEQMLDIMTRDDKDTLLVVTSTQRISISSKLLQIFSPLYRDILRDIPSTDRSQVTIIIPDTEAVHVKHLLDLMTSGRIKESLQSSDILALADCFKITLRENDLTFTFKPKKGSLRVRNIEEMCIPVPSESPKEDVTNKASSNNFSNVINIDDEKDVSRKRKKRKKEKKKENHFHEMACPPKSCSFCHEKTDHTKDCITRGTFQCHLCQARYKIQENLSNHFRMDHFIDITFFHCSLCNQRFKGPEELLKHLSAFHNRRTYTAVYKILNKIYFN